MSGLIHPQHHFVSRGGANSDRGPVSLWSSAFRYPKIAYLGKNNPAKSGIEIFKICIFASYTEIRAC
jgi:hypothetical protein